VKPIAWDPAKNELLKAKRGISFEAVVFHIQAGDIIETYDHPNKEVVQLSFCKSPCKAVSLG